jgi:triacylglycerol lipase
MITGFGFVVGVPSRYNATNFIKFGVENKQPFIFVTANYRMGPWGFLPGEQVMVNKSTNLGLHDQRMSIEWASDNIAAFGGDPDKITLWGHSAGGVSVFNHLVINEGNATYNGRQLFRGAIMSSGSLMPADYPNSTKCQEVYNAVVKAARCERKRDTLQCLRELPLADFERATNSIPGITAVETMRLLYIPRPDGELIRYSPEKLVNNSMFLAVPMILGNQEDEGTLFTQAQSSVNSGGRLNQYLRKHYFYNAKKSQMRDFVKTYSKKPFDGSPYRTGDDFEDWVGKKRFASVIGDALFVLTRRIAMAFVASSRPLVPLWGYQTSYDYRNGDSSLYGTSHGSFEAVIFGAGEYNTSYTTKSARAYFLNFVYNLDPNKRSPSLEFWPKWTIEEPRLLLFNKSRNAYLSDTYRTRSYQHMSHEIKLFRL